MGDAYRFLVNGFEVEARFPGETVEGVCRPLLETLTEKRRRLGRRLIAFLAAPPATGKSTLAAFLEHLSRRDPALVPVQALGLDGFHYHQDYILTHSVVRDGAEIPLRRIKGAPESFDLPKLEAALADARAGDPLWPVYDRRLHDVVEDAVRVTADILLVEGNWLLLDEPRWRDLRADYTAFIGAEEAFLRGRLVDRKARGGVPRAEAEAWADQNDLPNIRRCMARHRAADLELRLEGDGVLRRV